MLALTNKYLQLLILLFLSLIWGSSFILMKKGLESYHEHQVAALRISIAFIVLLPISLKYIRLISKKNLKPLLIAGFLGVFFPAFLFTKAQTKIDSSMAGILNSLTPLFTFIIGISFYKVKLKWLNLSGVLIGLIGAIGILLNGFQISSSTISWYAVFIILATICYGISVNEVKYLLMDLNTLQITSLSFLFIGPPAIIYLLFTDFSNATNTANYIRNLGFIVILAILCSVIAILVFNHLLKYTSAVFATSVTYIIPIFAIFWGIFDGETITVFQIVCTIIIFIGVYLVNKKQP